MTPFSKDPTTFGGDRVSRVTNSGGEQVIYYMNSRRNSD